MVSRGEMQERETFLARGACLLSGPAPTPFRISIHLATLISCHTTVERPARSLVAVRRR